MNRYKRLYVTACSGKDLCEHLGNLWEDFLQTVKSSRSVRLEGLFTAVGSIIVIYMSACAALQGRDFCSIASGVTK